MEGNEGLQVRGVSRRFGATPVLREVSLEAEPGLMTGLVGPNGAGKSTLFKIVTGLIDADEGRVLLAGRDLTRLPVHRRGAAGLGYLPQDSASFPDLTAAENVRAVLEVLPLSRSARRERLVDLLGRLGLEEAADRPYRVLSGGEQRRVEIAKALCGSPRILLLDEPFSGLDPAMIEGLATILRDLAGRGVGVLLTDHNVHMALPVVDRAYLLAGGAIVREGSPEELAADEWVRRTYLGRSFPCGG